MTEIEAQILYMRSVVLAAKDTANIDNWTKEDLLCVYHVVDKKDFVDVETWKKRVHLTDYIQDEDGLTEEQAQQQREGIEFIRQNQNIGIIKLGA